MAEIDPDLDKVDPENLVEVYSVFGLYGLERTHSLSVDQLEREMDDDPDGAIYHLRQAGKIKPGREEGRLKLDPAEKSTANEIFRELYHEDRNPEELVESGKLPEYLSDPDTTENFQGVGESLDQAPGDELYTRIMEVLSGGRALTPVEVEEELAVDVNFDLEPKLGYMETQNVATRREDGRYRLLTENIDHSFFGEELNEKGTLRERQRHRDNPWKPDR